MKKNIYQILLILGFSYSQNSVVRQFSTAFADVAEKVKPAVVTIITDKVVSLNQFDDFGFFFYPPNMPRQREYKTNALGSGVIVDSKNGYILTNNHVVDDMDGIKVKLIDKREFDAKVIGTDPKSDLAVLKIDASNLTDVKMGDSQKLRVGEWVMAVGSPFSENLSHTVTTGIVSAIGRSNILNSGSYEDFIQTDAAINPGNSGGALLNMDGNLIGINTAIATGGYEKGNQGVGFAIPSSMASRIMDDLIEKGYVTRSWLGVIIQELDNETAEALGINTRNGALIADVVQDSPAEIAGVQEGDVVVEFNNQKISNTANLKNVVSLATPESKSKLKVIRDGKEKTFNVTLQELPDNPEMFSKKRRNKSNKFGLQLSEVSDQLREKYGITDDNKVLVVTRINPDGQAYEKGIREGDVIKRIGTVKVTTLKEYRRQLEKAKNKDTVLFLIKKPGGSSRYYTLNNN